MTSLPSYLALLSLFLLSSCSTKKEFVKEKVCSPNAMTYLNGAKKRLKSAPRSDELKIKMAETQLGMQKCYQDYQRRTGVAEFQTCLVVGVDGLGMMEYYNFSSQDIHSDQEFIQCAVKVTKQVPYWQYGKNFVIVQSYSFY